MKLDSGNTEAITIKRGVEHGSILSIEIYRKALENTEDVIKVNGKLFYNQR